MTVTFPDSTDKLFDYLHRLEKNRYDVFLSPTFFRSLICPKNCGACCLKFSLDYITKDSQDQLKKIYPEKYKKYFKSRTVDGKIILSDEQINNPHTHCRFLSENGRCEIHSASPISCQIEPIKFRLVKERVYVSKQTFGRAWQMKRVSGERGCLCEFVGYSETQFQNDLRVLNDLNDVAIFFEIETVIPQIITLVESLGVNTKLKEKIAIQTNSSLLHPQSHLSNWILEL